MADDPKIALYFSHTKIAMTKTCHKDEVKAEEVISYKKKECGGRGCCLFLFFIEQTFRPSYGQYTNVHCTDSQGNRRRRGKLIR